jgi:DNA-directed RNA polymerase I, II, and III subunit RPABC4
MIVKADEDEVVEASGSDVDNSKRSNDVSDSSNRTTPQPEPEPEPEQPRSRSPGASSPRRISIRGVSPESRPDLYFHAAIDQSNRINQPARTNQPNLMSQLEPIIALDQLYQFTNHWEMTYDCGHCDEEVKIKSGEPMRCRMCGHRVLYKKRTKRVVQFEAW